MAWFLVQRLQRAGASRCVARRDRISFVMKALSAAALVLLVLVLVWQVVCELFKVPAYLIPSPVDVALRLYEKRELYLSHSLVTLYETTAGFCLAAVFGIVSAAIIVVVPKLRTIVMPVLLIAQLVPKVAIAPLLLIWFGYGLTPKVLVAFLVAFFPIVVNGASGTRGGTARASGARTVASSQPLADILEIQDADGAT